MQNPLLRCSASRISILTTPYHPIIPRRVHNPLHTRAIATVATPFRPISIQTKGPSRHSHYSPRATASPSRRNQALSTGLSTSIRTMSSSAQPPNKEEAEEQPFGHPAQPKKGSPSIPRPSASILLISPNNEILLLHRVKTSSAFPSAHVFPGGNIDVQDKVNGEVLAEGEERHRDGVAYRRGAVRECFEESGLLLARRKDTSGREGGRPGMLEVPEQEREKARKEIHAGRMRFVDWVESMGGVVDIDNLIPFTRWITPTNIPKRFTTQMYLYFLPLSPSPSSSSSSTSSSNSSASASTIATQKEQVLSIPTSDGGIEHTAASFASPASWLSKARSGDIILFPPQFYLLFLLSQFLTPPVAVGGPDTSPGAANGQSSPLTYEQLKGQREELMRFLETDGGDGSGVKWEEKCISPMHIDMLKRETGGREDRRSVLGLDRPGPEVEMEGSGRKGDMRRAVLVNFSKGGPRDVEVVERKEVMEELRALEKGKL